MAKVLTLSYRRVEGELSDGALLLSDDLDEVEVLESFNKAKYEEMLKAIARHVILHGNVAVVFSRTDRSGLAPMKMSEQELELFRTDPAAAIQNRIIPPQVVHIGVEKKEETMTMVQPLTTGYEMRADFFGELVFVRMKDGKLECPECGKWARGVLEKDPNFYFCNDCGRLTHVEEKSPDWAGIKVQGLTDSTIERLFLPRKWNKNGNWISRVELQKMLEEYLEEKAKVTCTP